jgi:hypothetical protein
MACGTISWAPLSLVPLCCLTVSHTLLACAAVRGFQRQRLTFPAKLSANYIFSHQLSISTASTRLRLLNTRAECGDAPTLNVTKKLNYLGVECGSCKWLVLDDWYQPLTQFSTPTNPAFHFYFKEAIVFLAQIIKDAKSLYLYQSIWKLAIRNKTQTEYAEIPIPNPINRSGQISQNVKVFFILSISPYC